jgi:hypothetical protein
MLIPVAKKAQRNIPSQNQIRRFRSRKPAKGMKNNIHQPLQKILNLIARQVSPKGPDAK